ncbi:5-formyltetrahydrofolate cyclo-ligase [Paraburkholderia phymatum]|uniref:5-formyltetrahydrofolate cyclo-ligase n=1 Tax=Paraburkholderia phymatum (strain DSM 17167 / CIP 108236 / LMG 21445 / STM815) TaxID=391038 RepID=B2JIM7_PARP8|nr:5-formyltetrahydrofolate cyclo-ligase [Paraburkholderia phymatum]ACC72073.1 5-formyltetrahydrofolate cyclo-ligase [Paraburkholderia phymatum STM815]
MNSSIACNPAAKSKKDLRATLLEARLHAAREAANNDALGRRVLDALTVYAPTSVGLYWPLSGEFDMRDALAVWLSGDGARRAALPVITGRDKPLEFHVWTPDMPMQVGAHRIHEPTSGEVIVPDVLFVPCVGFDADRYRLGYGGGYYDRTLAAFRRAGGPVPVTVGIAYEACRTDALAREAHDIPLDAVITDARWYSEPAASV